MGMSNDRGKEDGQPTLKRLPLISRGQPTETTWFAGLDAPETTVELVSETSDATPFAAWGDEHDACALMSVVNRTGLPSRSSLTHVLDGLIKMSHRAGMVNGEGDGCGVMLDIPREFWQARLSGADLDGEIALRPDFWLGHVLIKRGALDDAVMDTVSAEFERAGFAVIYNRRGLTVTDALGPQGQAEEPYFWQIAGISRLGGAPESEDERRLFHLKLRLEERLPIQFGSLSFHTATYKLRGSPDALDRYFLELNDERLKSVATLGHSRYCTNTVSSFFRVQPFPILGHNGEINTVARLRQEAKMLGVQLPADSSDSQDLDRLVETLICEYGYGLLEAMEIAFPPIVNEIKQLEPDLQNLYVFLRQAFGPFAQGPAGIVSRQGQECVFAVDALGLRPLWIGQLEDAYFFSSEKGVFAIEDMTADPRPLAPGEKVYLRLTPNEPETETEVWSYPRMQQEALKRLNQRLVIPKDTAKLIAFSQPPTVLPGDDTAVQLLPEVHILHPDDVRTEMMLAALGWSGDDLHYVEFLADTGNEPIGSLGYDGPLAALNKERRNLTDFFKENVAVVTNPAIDREREIEHFSTRVALGARPSLTGQPNGRIGTGPLGQRGLFNGGSNAPRPKLRPSRMVELSCPVLLGGHAGHEALLPPDLYWEAARHTDTYLLEELIEFVTQNGFRPEAVCIISACFQIDEEPADALNRMALEAITSVEAGAKLVLVDDTAALAGDELWLDPHLVIAHLDESLRSHAVPRRPGESYRNLRREASLILRSGAIRNLHDLILAFGLGADAVNPYLMIEAATTKARTDTTEPLARDKQIQKRVENLVEGLKKGLEKVISTMGIHELRAYGRLFASIGLSPEIARYFQSKNYAGSERGGFGWDNLRTDAQARQRVLNAETDPKLARDFHLYPKVWKVAGQVAGGVAPYEKFEGSVLALEAEDPISLRHVLDVKYPAQESSIEPHEVDISIERHNLPFAISSMSFGSQGETAYKAYAEAGALLNMVALNGEGGEIKEILGKYYNTRGVQIASGRFGVNIELLNSAHLLEIKIGQGAKPGEGGHLPGSKVTAKVAAARNAFKGVDLISPSNNHDIYSIEDLAQFISELKTANPDARVSVKVPVVSGIGTIAIGIAKAGADIIALSGFDGGTGAARAHALKYVGLPCEVGVVEAHRALVASGLRSQVEIWADGGLKTATDALKMILLGANRVGYGTLSMVAIGCTICRACQKDTCHVGIATQIESEEEAKERGLKRFVPQEDNRAVRQLVHMYSEMGEQLKRLVARLGFRRLQDLVGRTDLLTQARQLDLLDWSEMLVGPVEWLEQQRETADERNRQTQVCFPCAAAPVAISVGETTKLITAQVRGLALINQLSRVATGPDNSRAGVGESGPREVHYEGERLGSVDRAVGTHLSGALIRDGMGAGPAFAHNIAARGLTDMVGVAGQEEPIRGEETIKLHLNSGSLPGNGLAAFNNRSIKIIVEGGAQDGVGKGSLGGQVVVLKGKNRWGRRVDGSVGKSFAYGAQRGLFIIQGNADSRFGIRLSGADIVIGGELTEAIDDGLGYIGTRANLKGFAFEYMTNGRAIVLGDPGPWICSGMTGGVIYLRLQPELGLDLAALQRRIAKGAKVGMSRLNDHDKDNVRELLGYYHSELVATEQFEEADHLIPLQSNPDQHFIKVQPINQQVDPSISTE